MTVQESIYAILSADQTLTGLVSGRIYPDTPTTNTQLPFVVYWKSAGDPQNTLNSPTTLTQYTVSVECWALTLTEVAAIQDATTAVLDRYQGGPVQRCLLDNESTTPEDEGYHGQQEYQVWYNRTANIITGPSSTAKIVTSGDTITLSACDKALTLDCNGLLLNGAAVGGGGEVDPSSFVTIAGTSPGPNRFWWNDASLGTNMGLVYTTPAGLDIYLYD